MIREHVENTFEVVHVGGQTWPIIAAEHGEFGKRASVWNTPLQGSAWADDSESAWYSGEGESLGGSLNLKRGGNAPRSLGSSKAKPDIVGLISKVNQFPMMVKTTQGVAVPETLCQEQHQVLNTKTSSQSSGICCMTTEVKASTPGPIAVLAQSAIASGTSVDDTNKPSGSTGSKQSAPKAESADWEKILLQQEAHLRKMESTCMELTLALARVVSNQEKRPSQVSTPESAVGTLPQGDGSMSSQTKQLNAVNSKSQKRKAKAKAKADAKNLETTHSTTSGASPRSPQNSMASAGASTAVSSEPKGKEKELKTPESLKAQVHPQMCQCEPCKNKRASSDHGAMSTSS